MKIGKTEVQQHKLHQQKKLISICDVENYKALECDKVFSIKRVLNILMVTKIVLVRPYA